MTPDPRWFSGPLPSLSLTLLQQALDTRINVSIGDTRAAARSAQQTAVTARRLAAALTTTTTSNAPPLTSGPLSATSTPHRTETP